MKCLTKIHIFLFFKIKNNMSSHVELQLSQWLDYAEWSKACSGSAYSQILTV